MDIKRIIVIKEELEKMLMESYSDDTSEQHVEYLETASKSLKRLIRERANKTWILFGIIKLIINIIIHKGVLTNGN